MRFPISSVALALVLAVGAPAPAAAGVVFEVEVKLKPGTTFVVINHEEQYSIYPADRPVPEGWTSLGRTCKAEACLKHIEEVWTDMRPLSIRAHVKDQLQRHLGQR